MHNDSMTAHSASVRLDGYFVAVGSRRRSRPSCGGVYGAGPDGAFCRFALVNPIAFSALLRVVPLTFLPRGPMNVTKSAIRTPGSSVTRLCAPRSPRRQAPACAPDAPSLASGYAHPHHRLGRRRFPRPPSGGRLPWHTTNRIVSFSGCTLLSENPKFNSDVFIENPEMGNERGRPPPQAKARLFAYLNSSQMEFAFTSLENLPLMLSDRRPATASPPTPSPLHGGGGGRNRPSGEGLVPRKFPPPPPPAEPQQRREGIGS